jgi:hypothetical protein
MRNEPNKPVWPWIVGLLVLTPVLYAISFGPACWISSRAVVGDDAISVIYLPITWIMDGNEKIADQINWYAQIGATRGWGWIKWDVGNETWRWMFVSPPPRFR